jgi:hypothetical protein
MNKKIIKKSIFNFIFQVMIFKIFQNCSPLYQWHHITFYVKKIIQLNILVNILWTTTLGFCHFKSGLCYDNSKSIHEIHTM